MRFCERILKHMMLKKEMEKACVPDSLLKDYEEEELLELSQNINEMDAGIIVVAHTDDGAAGDACEAHVEVDGGACLAVYCAGASVKGDYAVAGADDFSAPGPFGGQVLEVNVVFFGQVF